MTAQMDGILNFDKPLGLTSAKTVERVRRIFGRPKIGHAGSLDPLARGVLVICLGRATKLVERLMDQPKIYRAELQLDITTPSFDLETPPAAVPVDVPLTEAELRAALRHFEGPILQAPPTTSAVKLAGRPAYKLARRGELTELPPRPVHVHWIRLRHFAWPVAKLEIACGRGTYIRALARDIGRQLNAGGCLTALERSAVGPLRLEESWTLERLDRLVDPSTAVLPLAEATALLSQPTPPPSPAPDDT